MRLCQMQDRAEDDLRFFPLLQQQFLLLSLALTNKHNYRQGKNKKLLTSTKQSTKLLGTKEEKIVLQ